eukprot:NODE_7263_length_410_cov_155.609418_g5616_i0.p1 GENE.NODE_7263_length_410_cov_155.609418_g5616_i0~~NODE_7263_length_410_cov_155.609418_g5616_i0.p1  ORF type:complete len:111 (+),score=32.49 NODE_7263_length_410_cov_155.609418_g5616_i0:33-335(+)
MGQACSNRVIIYDFEETLGILHTAGKGAVVAVLAGHSHRGGYAVDSAGIHHVTVQSPLIHSQDGQVAYGYVDVHQDRIEIRGQGALTSRTLDFPPLEPRS